MNNLVNSIIIEGIYQNGQLINTKKFIGGEYVSIFKLKFYNDKMKNYCVEGKGLRIVGWLAQIDNEVVIVPEHLEVRS